MDAYRVIKTAARNSAGRLAETDIIWKSSSFEELERRFPLSGNPDTDPIARRDYTVQQLATVGGTWLNIGDPRHPVTAAA